MRNALPDYTACCRENLSQVPSHTDLKTTTLCCSPAGRSAAWQQPLRQLLSRQAQGHPATCWAPTAIRYTSFQLQWVIATLPYCFRESYSHSSSHHHRYYYHHHYYSRPCSFLFSVLILLLVFLVPFFYVDLLPVLLVIHLGCSISYVLVIILVVLVIVLAVMFVLLVLNIFLDAFLMLIL
jgi:hypothetical protein